MSARDTRVEAEYKQAPARQKCDWLFAKTDSPDVALCWYYLIADFPHVCSLLNTMLRRMRCSKVKLFAVLLIFSAVVGVQHLLSRSEGDEEGSYLMDLFSSKLWRSSESIKPQAQGETWISGKPSI